MSIPEYYATLEWIRLRDRVLERDQRRCWYCGEQASTADHVIPRGYGGADSLENLVACCLICNTVAGGRRFPHRGAKRKWVRAEVKRRTTTSPAQPSFDRSHYQETMRLLAKKRKAKR